MEIWKPIKAIEGMEISDRGRVRGRWHGLLNMIREPQEHPSGYLYIPHRINGRQITLYIHREVARAFVRNPRNLKYVKHKNGIRRDNTAANLRWDSVRPGARIPA